MAPLFFAAASGVLAQQSGWPQWGREPGHGGAAPVAGQPLTEILAEFVYDPFVAAEEAEAGGDLLVHYAVPLVDGGDVYMASKSGTYVACIPPGSGSPFPCGPDARDAQVWNVTKLHWQGTALVTDWTFASDWVPPPDAGGLGGWEPVFLPALFGRFVYVPGAGGTLLKVSKDAGAEVARINPFSGVASFRYVSGGLAVGPDGAVFYQAIELDPAGPWSLDARGAWLVRVGSDDVAASVPFAPLVPGAPHPTDQCRLSFSTSDLPWPPSPAAVAPTGPCGSQRPGVNVVPAIAPDGTIYVVSRAHLNSRYAYLVAVRPDLTPRWSASLRGILADGCAVGLPPNGSPGGCRSLAPTGVDPATNELPAGRISDQGTSSPVVLPDGAVLYGALTRYNYARGHLFKFDPEGQVLATYDFGWDITPAVRAHDGTYSVMLKDNHYDVGSYCGDPAYCPIESSRYDLVSLDAGLVPEWTHTNSTAEACARRPDGTVVCEPSAEVGFEWCVNQPAVDVDGVTYANSEDGFLYAVGPDGLLRGRIFLDLALGAAYTPVALGDDGRIYAQNNGRLFVIGRPPTARGTAVSPARSPSPPRVVERP